MCTQDLLRKAGVEGTPVCAFLEDHHLSDPSFLEYINSLLSSGEVPGLFAPEELEKELKGLDAVKVDEGAGDVSSYHFFVQRVRTVRARTLVNATDCFIYKKIK